MSYCRYVNEGASQFLDELGVQRSHVAIRNWVHKADLQPISTVSANQLAVDEKVIRVRLNKIIVDGCPIDDLLLLLGTEVNSNSQILSNPLSKQAIVLNRDKRCQDNAYTNPLSALTYPP